MPKKCPPGVICVDNLVFITMFVSLIGVIAFVVYRSTNFGAGAGAGAHSHARAGGAGGHQQTGILQGLFPRPSYSFSNMSSDVLMNPYAAPHRDDRVVTNDIRGGVPINQSTRAVDAEYRQIGILTKASGDGTVLPLMGRPLFTNRDKWQFYTMNDNNIKLPLSNKGKSCTNEYGCDNLYNGDSVYVEGLNQPFKVTVYDNAVMKYIPFA